jgi:hypothetical protein
MTRIWTVLFAAALVIGVAGCERSQPRGGGQPAAQPTGAAAVTATSGPTDADTGTAGQVDGMAQARQRLDEDRQRFEQDTRNVLARLDAHLQNWRRQLKTTEGEARQAAENEIAQVDAKAAEAREMLDKLKDAGDEGWVELAKGINAALREINQGLAAGPGGATASAPASQPDASSPSTK